MAAMPPPPHPAPRILTVGIELEMAIFDGATLEAIVGVLEGAGVDAKIGPYKKNDPAGLWRVTEDKTISTREIDVRYGNHDEWDTALAALGLSPDTPEPLHPQRKATPESSSDEDGFTHITPSQNSSDDEQEVVLKWEETISDEESTPPHCRACATRRNYIAAVRRRPRAEDKTVDQRCLRRRRRNQEQPVQVGGQ